MRKLDFESKTDRKLLEEILLKIKRFYPGAVVTEIFINKNGTVYANATTKSEKKTSSHLFILVEDKHKELEVSSSIMETTFIPVADSELIGLLHSEDSGFESFKIITDIDSKICFGEKAKQMKDKNNNCLIISINYLGSCLDIFLDLNTGKVIGRINYVTGAGTQINDSHNFSLAEYEAEFVRNADESHEVFEDNRSRVQGDFLEKILRLSSNTEVAVEE